MAQYDRHVFVCTSGETCPMQGDTEKFVKTLRAGVQKASRQGDVRINKSGCFSQCGHGPMIVVYPEDVWYAGVHESDLEEILISHIVGGVPVERLRYAPGVKGANKVDVAPKDRPGATAGASQGPGWTRVCRVNEVPANGMKEFTVDGTSVLVAHTPDGFVAYQSLCPHEAIPLEQGIHDGGTLTCLEHMWQFDLKTGAPIGEAETALKAYRLRTDGEDLYVALEG